MYRSNIRFLHVSWLIIFAGSFHEGTKERVKCDECGAFVKNLRPHKKMKHEKIKYPCSRCPFQASSMAYLKSHEAGLHDGIKTKCSKCDFLGSDFVVKQHIVRVHDGVRHRCDQCTMVYKSGGQLKKHKMKKHGINHIKRDYQRDNDNIGMKLGAEESWNIILALSLILNVWYKA